MNKVELEGKVSRQPEIKYTGTGKAVCNVTVVTVRPYTKDGEKKEYKTFIDVKAWDKIAEQAAELKEGDTVQVQGELRTESWEKDGKKHYKLAVTANSITCR